MLRILKHVSPNFSALFDIITSYLSPKSPGVGELETSPKYVKLNGHWLLKVYISEFVLLAFALQGY